MRFCGGLPAIVGLVVILSWHYGIDQMLSILSDAVTMKYVTALSFVLSGFGMSLAGSRAKYAALCRDGIAMMIGSVQLTVLLGGVPQAFETRDAVYTVAPDTPSLGTVTLFLLTAIVITIDRERSWIRRAFGSVILAGASVPLIGYAFNLPALMYYQEHVSTAMAVHTAACFIFIGAAGCMPLTYME